MYLQYHTKRNSIILVRHIKAYIKIFKKAFYATITHFLYHITENLEYNLHEPHICKEIIQVF